MAQAKNGDTVKVHFTCRFEDGTVFETSVGSEPLQFTIGRGEVITGLEQAIVGMNSGESKTIQVPADKAYGPYQEELVKVVDRDEFPENLQPEIGMKFQIHRADSVTKVIAVTDISESSVTLDANHPLAGKNPIFDIQLIEIIKPKPAYEISPAAEAYYNLGVSLHERGQLDKAIQLYQMAVAHEPNFAEAYLNLGIVFKEKGQPDEAIQCCKKAIEIRPDYAMAYYNLGNAYVLKGQFDEATKFYQKAIEINPDYAEAHWNIALLNLLSGNFKEGWKGYEWRLELEDVSPKRNFLQPLWDESNISGRIILLHAEQGFGDTIQFIRYAPLVAQRGAKVIVECQKELTTLLKNVGGIQDIIAHGEQLPEFDVHCPLLSLPLVFGTTLETIPEKIPYISADPTLVKKWREKIVLDNSKFKIGLVWAGDPRLKDDRTRSCSLEIFAPLTQFEDVIFYSLQKGEAANQAKNPPKNMKLIDYTDEINDFSDTAALIENLDLIISIDTAVAHLAGALGKPVWTLLPFVPDWRWMLNREDSPWYPTMRLFRQPSPGDWEPVIGRIVKELKIFRNNAIERR